MTVLITGGTGKTGRRLAEHLAKRGIQARIASRRPEGGSPFDWHDRNTWDVTLKGVTSAYLVAPPGDSAALMIDFAAHAQESGCRRFVLLSASLLPAGGPGTGQVHAWLATQTAEWAVLRPSWFMQNFSEGVHAATIRKEGCIYTAAEDGRIGFVSADDIAAVAAVMLTTAVAPNSEAILTGPDAISYDTAAVTLSGALGRTIRHVRVGVDDLAARHRANGMPPIAAQILASMDAMIANGAEDRTTDQVAQFTGYPPTGFDAFCRSLVEKR